MSRLKFYEWDSPETQREMIKARIDELENERYTATRKAEQCLSEIVSLRKQYLETYAKEARKNEQKD